MEPSQLLQPESEDMSLSAFRGSTPAPSPISTTSTLSTSTSTPETRTDFTPVRKGEKRIRKDDLKSSDAKQNSSPQAANLDTMPVDIQNMILQTLTFQDLIAVRTVCKRLHQAVRQVHGNDFSISRTCVVDERRQMRYSRYPIQLGNAHLVGLQLKNCFTRSRYKPLRFTLALENPQLPIAELHVVENTLITTRDYEELQGRNIGPLVVGPDRIVRTDALAFAHTLSVLGDPYEHCRFLQQWIDLCPKAVDIHFENTVLLYRTTFTTSSQPEPIQEQLEKVRFPFLRLKRDSPTTPFHHIECTWSCLTKLPQSLVEHCTFARILGPGRISTTVLRTLLPCLTHLVLVEGACPSEAAAIEPLTGITHVTLDNCDEPSCILYPSVWPDLQLVHIQNMRPCSVAIPYTCAATMVDISGRRAYMSADTLAPRNRMRKALFSKENDETANLATMPFFLFERMSHHLNFRDLTALSSTCKDIRKILHDMPLELVPRLRRPAVSVQQALSLIQSHLDLCTHFQTRQLERLGKLYDEQPEKKGLVCRPRYRFQIANQCAFAVHLREDDDAHSIIKLTSYPDIWFVRWAVNTRSPCITCPLDRIGTLTIREHRSSQIFQRLSMIPKRTSSPRRRLQTSQSYRSCPLYLHLEHCSLDEDIFRWALQNHQLVFLLQKCKFTFQHKTEEYIDHLRLLRLPQKGQYRLEMIQTQSDRWFEILRHEWQHWQETYQVRITILSLTRCNYLTLNVFPHLHTLVVHDGQLFLPHPHANLTCLSVRRSRISWNFPYVRRLQLENITSAQMLCTAVHLPVLEYLLVNQEDTSTPCLIIDNRQVRQLEWDVDKNPLSLADTIEQQFPLWSDLTETDLVTSHIPLD